jgi:hypothetical protein
MQNGDCLRSLLYVYNAYRRRTKMLKTTQGRSDPLEFARLRSISREKLETLEDLLHVIEGREPNGSHLVKMLGSTAAHLVDHLGQSPDKIPIHRLLDVRSGFKAYLKDRRFKRNSIRSYGNYLRILVQRAREVGWAECSPELAAAWQKIRQLLKTAVGCQRIVDYAIAKGTRPCDFTDTTLAEWGQAAVASGCATSTPGPGGQSFGGLSFRVGWLQKCRGFGLHLTIPTAFRSTNYLLLYAVR